MSPGLRSRTGLRRREKKSLTGIDTEYLDRVLATFSGYLAIDELYDGPFCVISVVDNRMYQRLAYRVLEKSPTKGDVRRFLREFAARLDSRGCRVRGITTDGSSLYPKALAKVFPGVPHQVCKFHVLKEITRAILHTLARVRKQWQAKIPKQPRGRPSRSRAKAARRARRMQQRSTDLFANRHLFVRRHLRPSQKETLRQVTRGLPQLRTLREIMDEVYRLFDRRCRTETALDRLDQLQRRVCRFPRLEKALAPLFTPNLEKALTFLDDKLLPATSNAVERSNRREVCCLRFFPTNFGFRDYGIVEDVKFKSGPSQQAAARGWRGGRQARRSSTSGRQRLSRAVADQDAAPMFVAHP